MDGVNIMVKSSLKRGVGHKHGNLREELIRVAMQLLDENGVEAVTVREVARRASVAHSAPANHFSSRNDLLTALAREIFSSLADRVVDKVQAKTDLAAAVQAFIGVWMAFALSTPHRYRLLWRRDLVDHNDPALAEEMDRVYNLLLGVLDQGSVARRIDVDTGAIAIWSMVHGYVSLRLDGNFQPATDTISGLPREAAIQLALLDGLGIR